MKSSQIKLVKMSFKGRCHIVSGPPGSGKSTFSNKLAHSFSRSINIEGDSIYNMVEKGYSNPWEPSGAKLVELMCETASNQSLIYMKEGFDVIFNYVFELKELKYTLKYLSTEKNRLNLYILMPKVETLVQQDKNRECTVGENLVRSYHNKFQEMISQSSWLEKYVIDCRVDKIEEIDLNYYELCEVL